MKQILFGVSAVVVLGLYSCSSHRDHQYPQEQNDVSVKPFSNDVDIEADAGNAAFDVSALSEIVKSSTDPKVLEEKINDPATNINNLDLDKDGKIDYLTITESGQNQLEIKDAAVQPEVMVARLTVTPDNDAQTASLQIQGTPTYCGHHHDYYQPHISFGTMLFMAYLMRPHAYYMPMYGYGRYPSSYTTRRTVVRTSYRPTSSPYARGSSRSAGGSSRFGSSTSRFGRSSMSSPTSSRRSFSTRSSSRPIGSGGFGRSSSSYRSSGSSRSFSSGSRRSFGGRRR